MEEGEVGVDGKEEEDEEFTDVGLIKGLRIGNGTTSSSKPCGE